MLFSQHRRRRANDLENNSAARHRADNVLRLTFASKSAAAVIAIGVPGPSPGLRPRDLIGFLSCCLEFKDSKDAKIAVQYKLTDDVRLQSELRSPNLPHPASITRRRAFWACIDDLPVI